MPVASPFALVITSRAIAFGITSTLPVLSAGLTKTEEEEKSAYTVQPLLHCEQKKQAPRSLLIGFVRIDKREGITGISNLPPASLIKSSCNLGFGGGRKILSGSLGRFSLDPNTPINLSTLS